MLIIPLWALIVLILLGIILIIIFFLYIYSSTYLLSPGSCAISHGSYAVRQGTSSAVLNQCGIGSTAPCTFTGITSLTSAINICEQNSTVCSAFNYTPSTNTVGFVNKYASTMSAASSTDLYTRVVNVSAGSTSS